jgi:large conductance mechanosensitive channel
LCLLRYRETGGQFREIRHPRTDKEDYTMLKEFKEFALRGNVVDMAVGIIIGGAFGTIVKSLVSDILMPPIGLLMGGVDFTNIFLTLKGNAEPTLEAAKKAGSVTMNIGLFINSVISFLIVAFALFLVIKALNAAKKKEEEAPAKPAEPPKQEVLLEEIRDLLKK